MSSWERLSSKQETSFEARSTGRGIYEEIFDIVLKLEQVSTGGLHLQCGTK